MTANLPALVVTLAAASISWSSANSVATGDQDHPAVAANRTGRVAVVWEDDRDTTNPADDNHSDIYLRAYQDGTPVFEKKLSAGGTAGKNWTHRSPDVGLDDRGDAVVVWSDDPDGNGYFDIAYRVLSPTGAVLGSGRANANSAGDQIVPKVAVDPDGTPGNASAVAFSAVWEDLQGTVATVRAAGWTGATTKAYEVAAGQATGAHHRPDVAVSAAGDATVVWEQDADGNGYCDIGLTRLAKATGAVQLARTTANHTTAGQQRRPAVAANYAGDLIVAWESDDTGSNQVYARAFTPGGSGRYPEVAASSGPGAADPSVGLDDLGDAVVGWTVAGADVLVRGLNPDGSTKGRLPTATMTQTTTGRQDDLALAVSPWSEVAVAYTDDADGNDWDQVMLGVGTTNDDTLDGRDDSAAALPRRTTAL